MCSYVIKAGVHVVCVLGVWCAIYHPTLKVVCHLCVVVEVYLHFSCQCLKVAEEEGFKSKAMEGRWEVQGEMWVGAD